MTMLKRFIALLAMVTALSLVACSGTNQEGGTQGESQPVRIGTVFTATDTLDPSTTTSLGGMTVIFHVYDALVIMTADGPVMSLAESVEPNQTADEWTITLRDGAKYSTGNPVTGQDVFASLQYLSQSPNFSFMYSTIDFAASTVEEQRVTLKLVAPAADFVESVLGMFSSVAPDGKFEGIGAGPYVVDQGDATTGFQLSANENYWAGRPAIPQITLVPIPDANSRATALQSGEIDYALGLDSSGLNALSGAKDIVIPEETLDSAGALELVLNTRVAPFNNPELRRAAKLAIDREKMVSTLLGDIGEVGNDLLGKGYPGYSDSIAQTAVNKNEAKKIFAEHGVSSFTIVASDVLPGLVASAELMAQEFA